MTFEYNMQSLIISWIKKTSPKGIIETMEEIRILNTILGNSVHVKFAECVNCIEVMWQNALVCKTYVEIIRDDMLKCVQLAHYKIQCLHCVCVCLWSVVSVSSSVEFSRQEY